MNFFSTGDRRIVLFLMALYAIDPFSYGFVFGYLLSIFIFVNLKKLSHLLDRTFLSLFLFSTVYAVFYTFNLDMGVQFIFIYALIPASLYLAGKMLYIESEKLNIQTLFLLGFLFSVSSMASVFKEIIVHGFVTIKRDVPSIWTGDIVPATNTAAYFVMNMCIPGILLVGYKQVKPHFLKIFSVLLFLLSLTCVLRLGSRTHLAITIFSVLIAVFYRLKKQNIVQNFVLLAVIFVGVNLGFAYLSLDSDSDILSAYADRMDSKEHGVSTAGGRLNKWEKSIIYMFKEPLGWDLDEFGYSHNLWFDATRIGGVISFVLLLIFTFYTLRILLKVLRIRQKIFLLDGQLLIYFISFILVFLVEPILDGLFVLFSIFCAVVGFTQSHCLKLDLEKNDKNNSSYSLNSKELI